MSKLIDVIYYNVFNLISISFNFLTIGGNQMMEFITHILIPIYYVVWLVFFFIYAIEDTNNSKIPYITRKIDLIISMLPFGYTIIVFIKYFNKLK